MITTLRKLEQMIDTNLLFPGASIAIFRSPAASQSRSKLNIWLRQILAKRENTSHANKGQAFRRD